MAVPSYTTDLLTFELCAGSANFLPEFTGYTEGRTETQDTDYEIQGSGHVSKQYNATGLGSLGIEYPTGPGDPVAGWVSGWNFFLWGVFLPAGAVDTYAQGGLRMIVGSDDTNFRVWTVGGSDFGSYPYGGWQNFVVDPETPGDYTDGGTYTSDYGVVGLATNVVAAISKGNPFGIDAIRYGRGEIRAVAGSVGDGYATFGGMATANDLNANMWGLFQVIPGGYLFKGKMVLGYGGLVDFTDTNKNILIDDTRKVLSSFNRIEITTATSTVNWTNISITSLGSVARGELEMMHNAEFNDTGGVFTDMSTFIYLADATITGKTYRRCGQVTQGGGTFAGCTFEKSDAAISLLADDLTLISDCDFESDGNGYAIEGFSAAGSYTLDGLTFTGYASSDGTTGDEALHVTATTGTVTINYTGAAPSVHTAGATIIKVGVSVDVSVVCKTVDGTEVQNARVLLKAKDDTGDFPFEETVTSITNVGTLATVAHTAHGMASNDYVQIRGASQLANNGVFQITVNSVDEYEYTMLSSPSSPTGTIKCTFVALYGLSNASGIVTTSREYGTDQPVVGWARKSTGSPLYKSAPLVGEVDDLLGYSATGVLILDE